MRTRATRAAWVIPALLFFFNATPLVAQTPTAEDVRTLLAERVGGLDLLRVPENNTDLPQPRLENGEVDPLYVITEEKRYLGKLLFHDPIRANHILPDFGGDPSTSQTASCGSCHFGEAAAKAGQVQSVGVGGRGRMEMEPDGSFVLTREVAPGMVDTLPTPLEVFDDEGNVVISGKFDMVDAPGRLAPTIIGFAYNNRLFWDGAAGEPFNPDNPTLPNLNPDGLPTGENLAQATTGAHRMAETQQFALQKNPAYVKLFEAAFPEEHAASVASGNLDDLVNDNTIQRALAAYMRTVISRNTPWDRFLAGDDSALTSSQLEGAWLFAATTAAGGADCISCHSGPALNKQIGDEAGELVEENFYNLGLNDHPNQELARTTLGNPEHRDNGRAGVTGNPDHAFKFRSVTLRQIADGRQYMHSGELDSIRAVLEYFNDGVPLGADAATAGTLAPRFSNPRGPETVGLGLSPEDLDALEDFLTNSLHDDTFVHYDPGSSTDTFDPNTDDLTYSEELKALGAINGLLPSQMAVGNDDSMSRGQTIFARGRINSDSRIDVSDGIFLISHLFGGGPAPVPLVAADTNGDSLVDLSDALYLLGYFFLGGPQPPMPFPDPGQLVL